MVKHINVSHHIQFCSTSVLAKKSKHTECLIRERIEAWLHPDNMNRGEGFSLTPLLTTGWPWKELQPRPVPCH
jgi:hypothetical protein